MIDIEKAIEIAEEILKKLDQCENTPYPDIMDEAQDFYAIVLQLLKEKAEKKRNLKLYDHKLKGE